MRAAVQEGYGGPQVVRLRTLPHPIPPAGQVLVRVRAASANAMDGHLLRLPLPMRMFMGVRRPKLTVPGVDLAGVVEAIGAGVTRFKPGDAVFGSARGAFAEYTVAGEDKLAIKRPELSFAQAATLGVAGITALQGLRDEAGVRAGQRVLIHGAGGGGGTFAVQLARALGARVTAITGPRNVELVRSLGPDLVLDYSREDVARRPERYELCFDVAATRSLSDCLRVLEPGGILLRVGAPKEGGWLRLLMSLIALTVRRPFSRRRMRILMAKSNASDLQILQDFVTQGKLRPAIDRSYPVSQVADALGYVASGQARAKVVIEM
jgi:NADPH:quinone reductase-like Zn-dependent oxidoreductase